jgi:hypothetical protein
MLVPLADDDVPTPTMSKAPVSKSRRNTLATQPDLSFISEGSTEADQHVQSRCAFRL